MIVPTSYYRCTACGWYHASAYLTGQTAPVVALTCPHCRHPEAERMLMGSDLKALEEQLHELANRVNLLALAAERERRRR